MIVVPASPAINRAAVFVLFFGVNAILQPSLLSIRVLESNLTSFLPLILVAVGQTYVILAADIDLSVGSIIALVNVSVVTLIEAMPQEHEGRAVQPQHRAPVFGVLRELRQVPG